VEVGAELGTVANRKVGPGIKESKMELFSPTNGEKKEFGSKY
jgi:hypothetical protein